MDYSRIIYFDMDGVLANFNQGVIDLLHMTPHKQGDGPLDYKHANELYAKMREVDHFYGQLKPIPEAVQLFIELHAMYGNAVQILSAVPRPHRGIITAKDDKIDWVKREISSDVIVNICYRKEKASFCKGKDFILIDDYDKNINEWEALGGTGILYDNIENVKKALNDILKIKL